MQLCTPHRDRTYDSNEHWLLQNIGGKCGLKENSMCTPQGGEEGVGHKPAQDEGGVGPTMRHKDGWHRPCMHKCFVCIRMVGTGPACMHTGTCTSDIGDVGGVPWRSEW